MTLAKNRIAVCLGAGRSGTSLTMNILRKLGVTSSEEMIEPSEQNHDGGFEDKFIFEAHSQFYRDVGSNHFLPLSKKSFESEHANTLRFKVTKYMKDKVESGNVWGFKDPRTSSLLPIWIKAFNAAKVVPKYILCVRSPSAVVASLDTQYGYDPKVSELFWLTKYLDALRDTGGNVFIIHYEDWFTDKAYSIVSELIEYLGLQDKSGNEIEAILNSTIKSTMNRSKWRKADISSKIVTEFYDTILKCRGSDFDHEMLMTKLVEIEEVVDQFRGWHLSAELLNIKFSENRVVNNKNRHGNSSENNKVISKDLNTSELCQKIRQNNVFIKELREQLQAQSLQISQLKRESGKRNNILEKELEVIKRQSEKVKKENEILKRDYDMIRASSSFRFSYILMKAIKKPGFDTIAFPFRAMKLLIRKVSKS